MNEKPGMDLRALVVGLLCAAVFNVVAGYLVFHLFWG
jgi:hypothetical protein